MKERKKFLIKSIIITGHSVCIQIIVTSTYSPWICIWYQFSCIRKLHFAYSLCGLNLKCWLFGRMPFFIHVEATALMTCRLFCLGNRKLHLLHLLFSFWDLNAVFWSPSIMYNYFYLFIGELWRGSLAWNSTIDKIAVTFTKHCEGGDQCYPCWKMFLDLRQILFQSKSKIIQSR